MIRFFRQNIHWFALIALLCAFVVQSRLRFHDPFLFSWDSVQFALSIEHFDVRLHQPHPPGYVLYSATIWIFNHLVEDPNLTMIYMNIGATIGAAFLLALLSGELIPGDAGRVHRFVGQAGAAALYVVNAVVWFHGCIAEIYAVEAFFVALILYLLVVSNRKSYTFLWASLALAVAGGFRPTTEVFLFPIYLAFLPGKNWKILLYSALILLVVNISWMIPLMYLSGGPQKYFRAAFRQTENAVTGVLPNAPRILMGFRLVQVPGLILLAALFAKIHRWQFTRNQALVALSLIPGLLFHLFIHFTKDGYLMVLIPPIVATASALLIRLYRTQVSAILILATVIVHVHLFKKPDMYRIEETKTSAAKFIVNQFQSPNRYVTGAHAERLREFMNQAARVNHPRTMFVIDSTSFPDWRTVEYYYPDDLAVFVTGRRKAYFARNHEFTIVTSPIDLPPDVRSIILISTSHPPFPMDSFQFFEFRSYYALRKEIPDEFELAGYPFRKQKR